jgi:hypothetical protein
MIPQEYFDKVKERFNGDMDKTWQWFKTPNASLGMFTPLDALKLGKEARVKQVINQMIKGYYP